MIYLIDRDLSDLWVRRVQILENTCINSGVGQCLEDIKAAFSTIDRKVSTTEAYPLAVLLL